MTPEPLPPIVALMRAELEAYGGLLAAFDRQQRHILGQQLDAAEEDNRAVLTLTEEAEVCRSARERWVRDFAQAQGQPESQSLREMLSVFPVPQQPLIEALIDEINHLIDRVRRRARQNHGLLARALELHREVLQQFTPGVRPRTYAPSGRVPAMVGVNGLQALG